MSVKAKAKQKPGSHTGLGSQRSTYSSEARGAGWTSRTRRTRKPRLSRDAILSRGASGSLDQERVGLL